MMNIKLIIELGIKKKEKFKKLEMGSKKVHVAGIGWCYEVTAELENKLEKNVMGDKKVRTLPLNKKSK